MTKSPLTAVTASRGSMLDRLRSRIVPSPPAEPIDRDRLTRYDDPAAKFTETVGLVGGEAHHVRSAEEIAEILSGIAVYRDAQRVASTVPHLVAGNVDAAAIDDPHALASLDWMIAAGEFAVAENGAVWVDGKTLPHRVMLFIAQYLALVVPRQQIVSNMHEAYARIENPASGFGVFVSGPSKTADIEQSLVLGAHGCRTLQVFLLD